MIIVYFPSKRDGLIVECTQHNIVHSSFHYIDTNAQSAFSARLKFQASA